MNTGDSNDSSSSHNLTDLPGSLADFLELVFDAVVMLDTRERVTYWDPAAEQMFGWTAQEALGKTPAKLFWPVSTPEEKKKHKQRKSRLERGETLRDEHDVSRKDGSSFCVQYVARAILDGEGKVSGYLAIYRETSAREIAERKQNEESLRARTEEIETLLEVSPVAIFVAHDPQCTHITGNPAGYRLVELPKDVNISKSAPARERPTYRTFRNGVEVPAEDLPMQKAARLGMEISEDELELRFEDGSQKFIYAFAKPLFDAQGKLRGAVAAMLDITERKQAEDQLERSNQKLNEILASIQDDFYVIDRNWIFVYANRQFTTKLGKEPEDLIGNNIWTMFPKHVGMPLEENFRAAMEKRQMRRFEIPGQYTDAWYGITVFPSSEGITVLGTDITARKQMEDTLRESEERLRQMIETSLVAIGFGDSTGKIFEANASFYRLTGYSREEIESDQLGWDQLTAPEYAELDRQMIAKLITTGSAGPYEKEYIRKDGSRIPLLLTMSKLPGRDEHIAFIIDITERKQAEETLVRQRELLQRVFENIPVLLIMWDPHLQKFTLNRHAETVLGWTTTDANEGDFMKIVYPDPVYRADVSAYMQSLASGFRELSTTAKNGERIPIEWANIKLADNTMIGIGVDMRKHKQAENALRENQKQLQLLNETLEQQIHEKTAEIRSLASDLVKAVQHERHRISHILHDDLQQRIYAMQMQLAFLHDAIQKNDPEARKEVSDVEEQLAEVLKITRHLSIDLSPPILRDEGLSHAINWLAVQMRQRYGLSIELETDGPFAIADEALHVLLFNCVRELLFNVVKHAQASRAVVALQWSDAGLQIDVRDDGKGFPIDMPEPQVNAEINEEDAVRSGFGLSTIRHQLSLFGGRMEIQSEPEAGTRVILIVPVTEAG